MNGDKGEEEKKNEQLLTRRRQCTEPNISVAFFIFV